MKNFTFAAPNGVRVQVRAENASQAQKLAAKRLQSAGHLRFGEMPSLVP